MDLNTLAETRSKWTLKERGEAFRKLRLKHGIALEDIANRSGVSRQTVSNFELATHAPNIQLEGRMLDAITDIIAERKTPDPSVERVLGGVTLRDLAAGEMPPYCELYGEAVKLVAALEAERQILSVTDFALAKLTAAEKILKLASDAPDAAKLAGLAKELVTEGRKTLSDRPSAEHPSRIVLE